MNRELSVGDTLSTMFGIYRDQASVLLPLAAGVFLVEVVISVVLVSIAPVLVLLALLVQIVATTLYTGMVVELVDDVRDGRRDHTIGQLFNAVTGVVVPLLLAGLLVGILVVIGLALLIVPGLVLLTIFAVVAPAIVLERKSAVDALGRSRELVRGNGLPVFGVIVAIFLLVFVVSAILGATIGAGAGTGGRIVGDLIGTTLTAPLSGLAAAVLYFELRGDGGAQPATDAGPASTDVLDGMPRD